MNKELTITEKRKRLINNTTEYLKLFILDFHNNLRELEELEEIENLKGIERGDQDNEKENFKN